MLRITLLGQFKVEKDGQPVEISSRQVQSLLAFLGLSAGIKHQRVKLAGLFWPDSSESNALSNLRHTLWRLRKAIGSEYLLADNQVIAFDPDADHWFDTAVLDQGLAEDTLPEDLIASVSAYSGELLPGYYDDWVILERERLQGVYDRKMKRLLDLLVDKCRWDDVLDWAERWIAFGQVPEPAYRALMVAHSGLGDISGVKRVYQRCVEVLDEELGVEPSADTRILYEQLLRGEKPSKASLPAEFQHRSPNILPMESPAFLDAKAMPVVDERAAFVGRDRELAQLDALLEKILAGRGQIVFVIGEAGQGKTSLVEAFSRRAQENNPNLIVATGVCSAYTGVGDPYLPFRDVMGMLTGDVETQWSSGVITRDHALRLWRLLPAVVGAIVGRGPDLLDTFVSAEALVGRMKNFPSSESGGLSRLQDRPVHPSRPVREYQEQSHLFQAYTQVLLALARQHPLVLILDDMHWADVSSISLLFHLARRTRESGILIVGTYRPEDLTVDRDGRQHPLESMISELRRLFGKIWIDLDREGGDADRAFVDALLDTEPNRLGERFRHELTRHTSGHPLFTVELLRDLQERGDLLQDKEGRWIAGPGLGWDTLPARVEGVIEKRIKRLDADLQDALTVASVVGESFTAEVVARVLGIEARTLVGNLSGELDKQHRLISGHGIQQLAGQRLSWYRFRHNLFQRYLYNQLDEAERVYLHKEVGEALETLYEDQLEEIAVKLVRHFQQAGDLDKTAGYLLQAGERAFRVYANQEAVELFNEGIELIKTLKETHERAKLELDLQIELGVALQVTKGRLDPEVGTALARARELCEQVGDPAQLFMVLWNLWLLSQANLSDKRELAEELMALAEQDGDPIHVLQALHLQWATSFYAGELRSAHEETERGIALYDSKQHFPLAFHFGGHDPGVCCMISSAEILWMLGWPDKALKRSQDTVNLGEALSHPYSQAFALTFASQVRIFRREPLQAQELAEEAISLSKAHGFPDYYGEAIIFRGWALAQQGQTEAGIAQILQGLDPNQSLPHEVERPYFLSLLAEAYWEAGQSGESLKLLDKALAEIKQGKVRYWDAEIHRLKGEYSQSQGMDLAEVERHYYRAIEIARWQGSKSLELRAVMSLCRLLRQRRKVKEDHEMLTEIYDWFTEGFDTPDLQEARVLLKELERG